tara:strand:- start:1025 stop:2704 length:1680 start_codon:yes stop_codon:yes gene_type:complete
MGRNHKVFIALRSKVIIGKEQPLLIKYRGEKQFSKTTGLLILPEHWDAKNRKIKDKYITDYPKLQREISRLEKRIREYLVELQSGEITPQTALEQILAKPFEDKSLSEFIDDWLEIGLKQGQFTKYKRQVRAIENKWGKEIRISELNDTMFCAKLANKIKETVTGNEYFSMLDRITVKAKLKNQNPFIKEDLKNKGIRQQRKIKKAQKELDPIRLTLAPNEITTHLQLASYLWFLYSYCLQGLDGADIVNLDEKMLKSADKSELTHFHPNGNFINPIRDYSNKYHIIKGRQKGNEMVVAMYNVFPVLFIRDWLYYLIGITHPQYSYKGDDRIRLFNFKTDSDNENPGWKQMRDNFRKVQTKLIGCSTKNSRDAFTAICEINLGLSRFNIDRMLGHYVEGGSTDHYLNNNSNMVARDIQQMQAIEELGVINLLKMSIDVFNGRKHKGKPFFNIKSKEFFAGLILLENGKRKLMDWSPEKEKKYQIEIAKVKIGKPEIIDGKIEYQTLNESEYSGELKELIEERDKISRRIPKISFTKKEREQNEKVLNEMIRKGILTPSK